MHKHLIACAAALLMLLTACDPGRVYEQNTNLPENSWAIDNEPEFKFDIKEPGQYDIFVNVRYNLQYEFYNLYLQHKLLAPDGKQLSGKLHEVVLMDPKTGKPLGKGSSDIFDLQQPLLENVTFTKPGTYTIRLTQYMRRDPLPYIQAVGIRVAKK